MDLYFGILYTLAGPFLMGLVYLAGMIKDAQIAAEEAASEARVNALDATYGGAS